VLVNEPPSCGLSLVLIGKNSHGQWVAQEQHGLFGGLFVNRADAVRYALFENGRHPEAVIEIPTILELDMNAPWMPPARPPAPASLRNQRPVA
jgi:hypothetical protein